MADPRLQDQAFSVNERLIDATIYRGIYLERFTAGEIAKLLISLEGQGGPYEMVLDRLAAVLSRLSARGPLRALGNTERGEALIASIREIMEEGTKAARQSAVASLANFATVEAQWQMAQIEGKIPSALAVKVFAPPTTVLRTILTQRAIEGQTLKKWFDQVGKTSADSIIRAVNIGMAQGDTFEQIMERVKGTGGVLPATSRGITSIVQTAISQVSTQAREAVFEANSDIISSVRIVAVLDGRTTAVCRARDGEIHPVGKGPRPPFHMKCRTTVVPVIKSMAELGFDLKDFPAGTRASMNGQVPGDINYNDWLARQPIDFQDDVLGPARGKLFRSGKFTMSRFVDFSGRQLTLDELAKLN